MTINFSVVYLLPFCKIKRGQAEIFICYITLSFLQNGKRIVEKCSPSRQYAAYTVSTQVNRSNENDLGHFSESLIDEKVFISKKLELQPGKSGANNSLKKKKSFSTSPYP
jgi:hypothetical protein